MGDSPWGFESPLRHSLPRSKQTGAVPAAPPPFRYSGLTPSWTASRPSHVLPFDVPSSDGLHIRRAARRRRNAPRSAAFASLDQRTPERARPRTSLALGRGASASARKHVAPCDRARLTSPPRSMHRLAVREQTLVELPLGEIDHLRRDARIRAAARRQSPWQRATRCDRRARRAARRVVRARACVTQLPARMIACRRCAAASRQPLRRRRRPARASASPSYATRLTPLAPFRAPLRSERSAGHAIGSSGLQHREPDALTHLALLCRRSEPGCTLFQHVVDLALQQSSTPGGCCSCADCGAALHSQPDASRSGDRTSRVRRP